jgi:hypothetical protein
MPIGSFATHADRVAARVPVPAYSLVPGHPDDNGTTTGCKGCAFRTMNVSCASIPCHRWGGRVAKVISN